MFKRSVVLGLMLTSILFAEIESDEKSTVVSNEAVKEDRLNIYERTCIACHRFLPLSLEHMYMRYLQTFSGEETFKASLKVFLKEPMEQTSVMSDLFIDRFSVKDKSLLTDKQLDEAIDIYWNLYDVRNRLK